MLQNVNAAEPWQRHAVHARGGGREQAELEHVREVVAEREEVGLREQPRLGIDVEVILTPPCVFCMENR